MIPRDMFQTVHFKEKPPKDAIYYGPKCPHCLSRRTKRIDDTSVRQCQVCGFSNLRGLLLPEVHCDWLENMSKDGQENRRTDAPMHDAEPPTDPTPIATPRLTLVTDG